MISFRKMQPTGTVQDDHQMARQESSDESRNPLCKKGRSGLSDRHFALRILADYVLPFVQEEQLVFAVAPTCSCWREPTAQMIEERRRAQNYAAFTHRQDLPRPPVCVAAFCGDIDALRRATPSEMETITAVHNLSVTQCAVLGGHSLDAVQYCLDHGGGKLGRVTRYGATSTHVAAWSGSLPMLRFVLANGGGALTAKDSFGSTATQYAAQGGSVAMIRHCVANGGGAIDAADNSRTAAIHHAAEGGHRAAMQYCAEHGGTFDDVNNDRTSVVHYAARSGNINALHFALQSVRNGALITAKNSNGCDALWFARRSNNTETIAYCEELLKEHPTAAPMASAAAAAA